MDSKNFVIIVAGGKGVRMGSAIKKQYLPIEEIPILTHTVMAFEKCEYINEIILVVPKEDIHYCKNYIIDPFKFKKIIHVIQGGEKRQDSVLNGLDLVQVRMSAAEKTIVMIHDGVRPFVDDETVKNCIDNAIKYGACIPALQIIDTLKEINSDSFILKTVNRATHYCAQTPQAFKLNIILQAFDHANETEFLGTDDASIVEHAGYNVYIVKGSKLNIKITTPEDLVLGKYLLTLNRS